MKLGTLVSCINIAATFIIATTTSFEPKNLKVNSIKLHFVNYNKDTLALIIICCSGGHQELLNCYFEILATVNGLRILIVVTGMLHLNLKGILRIGSCCHFLLCSCHFVSVYSISYLFLNTEFDCAGV